MSPLGVLCSSAFLLASVFAKAQQPPCAPHTEILRWLEDKHGEVPIAIAKMDGGGLIEVVVSPSGSWSILAIRSDGYACFVASGTGWTKPPAA